MNAPADLLHSKLRVYAIETELWKTDHDRAMAFFRFDDHLGTGIQLFESITRWDESWRSNVLAGEEQHDPMVADEIKEAYQCWFRPCAEVEAQLETFEREFGPTKNGERFRQCHRECAGLLTPDEEFFSGDALLQARDEAIDTHRRGDTVEFRDLCE